MVTDLLLTVVLFAIMHQVGAFKQGCSGIYRSGKTRPALHAPKLIMSWPAINITSIPEQATCSANDNASTAGFVCLPRLRFAPNITLTADFKSQSLVIPSKDTGAHQDLGTGPGNM